MKIHGAGTCPKTIAEWVVSPPLTYTTTKVQIVPTTLPIRTASQSGSFATTKGGIRTRFFIRPDLAV